MMVQGSRPDGASVTWETGCVVSHEGRTYEAGGASITPERLVGYMGPATGGHPSNTLRPGARGNVTTWDGQTIGRYVVKSVKPERRGVFSDHRVYVDVVAVVDSIARHYHGQTGGVGMSVVCKRRKSSDTA